MPSNGTLRYDGVAVTPGQTIAAFDPSRLTYDHDGSETTADSFTLTVTDDGGGTGTPATSAPQTIDLSILRNDDDPYLVNDVPQTVTGTTPTLAITSAMLAVADVDSPTTSLTYTLTSVPPAAAGYLEFTAAPGVRLVPGSTFTQADIDSGRLRYVAVSTADRTDSFTFTVKDGARRLYPAPQREGGIYQADDVTLQPITFEVDVSGLTVSGSGSGGDAVINADPNVGGTLALTPVETFEGQAVTITTTHLDASDPDNGPEELTYRLLTLPTSGSITLNGSALGYYDTFTQQDVNEGRVAFVHAGGEDFVDGFTFSLSDGLNVSADQTFTIDARPQNDTPTATLGSRIVLAEGTATAITAASLGISDADNSASDNETGYAVDNALKLVVTGTVAHGTLTLDGVPVVVGVTELTVADLQANKLVYTHDGSESFTDSFKVVPVDDQGILMAGTPAGNPGNQVSTGGELTVPITVNPLNDPPAGGLLGSKVEMTGANAIREGESRVIGGATGYDDTNGITGAGGYTGTAAGPHLVFIDPDNSTEQRQYRVTAAPASGTLFLAGKALGVGSVFTQEDLDAGRVSYTHKGGEDEGDYFEYVVSDGDYSANDTTSFPQGTSPTPSRYNIEILHTNDAPTVAAPAARSTSTARAARATRWRGSWSRTPTWSPWGRGSRTSCRPWCACSTPAATPSPTMRRASAAGA